MNTNQFNDVLARLKNKSAEHSENLNSFRAKFVAMQFGLQKLHREIEESKDRYQYLTNETSTGTPVMKLVPQDEMQRKAS